jgi:hypothetical protein
MPMIFTSRNVYKDRYRREFLREDQYRYVSFQISALITNTTETQDFTEYLWKNGIGRDSINPISKNKGKGLSILYW